MRAHAHVLASSAYETERSKFKLSQRMRSWQAG